MTVNDVLCLPCNDSILHKTAMNVVKKYNHTHRSLMYGRTPVELLDNLFMGDLAKNALLDYLRTNCKTPIIDYDEVRQDGFTQHDPGWDFKVGHQSLKLEVKSSIPPNGESIEELVNKRDIKITASHDKGATWIPPTSLESELHAQVYFYAKPYKEGFVSFDALQLALETNPEYLHEIINSKKYSKPLFLGWNAKQRIIQYHDSLLPNTWTFGKTSRIYWRCPIKESGTLPQLVAYIDSH